MNDPQTPVDPSTTDSRDALGYAPLPIAPPDPQGTPTTQQWCVIFLGLAGILFCVWFYPRSNDFNPRYWGLKRIFFENDTTAQQVVLSIVGLIALVPLLAPILLRRSRTGTHPETQAEATPTLLDGPTGIAAVEQTIFDY